MNLKSVSGNRNKICNIFEASTDQLAFLKFFIYEFKLLSIFFGHMWSMLHFRSWEYFSQFSHGIMLHFPFFRIFARIFLNIFARYHATHTIAGNCVSFQIWEKISILFFNTFHDLKSCIISNHGSIFQIFPRCHVTLSIVIILRRVL